MCAIPSPAISKSVSLPRPLPCGAPSDRAARAEHSAEPRTNGVAQRWVCFWVQRKPRLEEFSLADRHLIRAQPVGRQSAQVTLIGQHPPGLTPADDAEQSQDAGRGIATPAASSTPKEPTRQYQRSRTPPPRTRARPADAAAPRQDVDSPFDAIFGDQYRVVHQIQAMSLAEAGRIGRPFSDLRNRRRSSSVAASTSIPTAPISMSRSRWIASHFLEKESEPIQKNGRAKGCCIVRGSTFPV